MPDVSSPPYQALARRSQQVYYLLVVFDVLAVCAGLYLAHLTVTLLTHSAASHQGWVDRREQFAALEELASRANSHGNDVFADQDIKGHEERLRVDTAAFERALAAVR